MMVASWPNFEVKTVGAHLDKNVHHESGGDNSRIAFSRNIGPVSYNFNAFATFGQSFDGGDLGFE